MRSVKNYTFDDPANYTFDSDKVEIVAGKAQLKDLRPVDATFYASYAALIDANWGDGFLTGIPVGGAGVNAGKLDLAYDDLRYVNYNAADNADSPQTGCIRFTFIPNYDGANPTEQSIFCIAKAHNDSKNMIYLRHRLGGVAGQYLALHIYDKDGIFVTEQVLSFFVAVAGVSYEFELNYDFTNGATRFFIDGVQSHPTVTNTCLRDSNIALCRVGSNYKAQYTSNFKIDNFLVFSTVQHTADYTPDWSGIPETIYSTTNPTVLLNDSLCIEKINDFVPIINVSGLDIIKYILAKDGVFYFWDGTEWIVSDETYAQSNLIADINTNIAAFMGVAFTLQIKLFLHSEDGSANVKIDDLAVDYYSVKDGEFITYAEIKNEYQALDLIRLSNSDESDALVVDTEVMDRYIDDSEAIVKSFIQSLYTLPFVAVPGIIKEITLRIFIYKLFFRKQSPPLYIADAYFEAKKDLRDLQSGKVVLDILPTDIVFQDDLTQVEPDIGEIDKSFTETILGKM